MPSFNYTPSPDQLRELLPDVAARMEWDVFSHSARKLGIVYKSVLRKKCPVFEFQLTQGYTMKISPVDRGPQGLYEFYTVIKRPRQRQLRGGAPHFDFERVESIRVHVEVIDKDGTQIFSHTIHEESLEKIIRCALEGINQTKNLSLAPISRRGSKHKTRINKLKEQQELKLRLEEKSIEVEDEGDEE